MDKTMTSDIQRTVKRNKRIKEGMIENPSLAGKLADLVIVITLIAFAACCIIPLWHVVMASISDGEALLSHKGVVWAPVKEINFDGYKAMFKDSKILMGYANTLIYVVGGTFFGMMINILTGYVLSRESKIKIPYMMILTATMLFGGGLIPTYMVIRGLGWLGTRWSLLIPGCTNAFFIILAMNAFLGVPESTVEAARIDGAGHLKTLFRVMLPQAKSLITVIILNTAIGQWNSWFSASIYVTTKRELWPLQLWIKQIVAENANFLQSASPDFNRYLIQYVVIVIATLPVLAAFPFFQEQLEKGTITGGVKG